VCWWARRLAAAEAYLTLARRDTADAVVRFAALRETNGPVWFERLTLARVLAARGRTREALAVLDQEFPMKEWSSASRASWALERARLAERLGQLEKARYWYSYFIKLWRRADPRLQPYVTEARAALGRLSALPRQ
jgi:hypothetical protein